MVLHGIVIHGGVGSSTRLTRTCNTICHTAAGMLEEGRAALEAATAAVRLLEDDGRFNAGSGSTLRLDGVTVEMDAAVMDSSGRIGAVMALRDVKNPVLVARAVTDTPHVALAGRGAALFARVMGFGPSAPVSDRTLRRYRKMQRLVREGKLHEKDARWKESDVHRLWNFEVSYDDAFPLDTVGAVALDLSGAFAVAASTGGAAPMMMGRVGDTAMVGSGLYAGPVAAVAATGIGEEIIRRLLARTVYDFIAGGQPVKAACERGVSLFPREIPVGIIALSQEGYGIAANRRMAACGLVREA